MAVGLFIVAIGLGFVSLVVIAYCLFTSEDDPYDTEPVVDPGEPWLEDAVVFDFRPVRRHRP